MASQKTKLLEDDVEIVQLSASYSGIVSSFICSDEDKSLFLKHDALANQNQKLSETFLLFEKSTSRLVSYITLSFGSFKMSVNREIGGIPIREKPYRIFTDHIPCLLVAKLATHQEEEHRNGATLLLRFAIKRALEISGKYPLPFIALDSKPDKIDYYKGRGFAVAFTPERKETVTFQMFLRLQPPEA